MTSISVSNEVAQRGSESDRRFLLFDLSINGHHPIYIQHLIHYWYELDLPGQVDVVVSPKFIEKHADVVAFAAGYQQQTVKFVPISHEEETALNDRKSAFSRNSRNFKEWKILQKYALQLRASHCLILYFDTCQLPLAFGARLSCPFSGIYFRPTFHYSNFTQRSLSYKEKLQVLREKLILSRVLSHPNLKTLFSLDTFAVNYLNTASARSIVVPLPDPVQLPDTSSLKTDELRAQLEIERDRQVFLLFGALDSRKGIFQVLDAVSLLPAELSQKVCLVFVGQVKATEQTELEVKIALTSQVCPVQIVYRNAFISDPEVQAYFDLTDVVLATYQRHVGMSGILMLAAAAQKPALSSDYGLMGEIVRRYQLGLTVDSTNPIEIAQGIAQFLTRKPEELCDRDQMKQFAEQNSPEHFAKVIFDQLLSSN